MFGVENVFVSGLVSTTRVDVSLLERFHVLILEKKKKNCFIYIDNRNIKSNSITIKIDENVFLNDLLLKY